MQFSVVIPAYNEAENLPRLLASLEAAKAGHVLEILIIDNHSTDETRKIATEADARLIVPQERVRIAALRNMGAEAASHETIVFLDADMEAPANWFDLIAHELSLGDADGMGFVEDIPDEAPWFARIWSRRTKARRDRRRRADFLPGRNIVVRKDQFRKAGGFSSTMMTSEDKDFVMRLTAAGARLYSIPPVGLIHWGYEKTFGEWVRKEFWRQHSHIAMMNRHGLRPRIIRFPLLSLLHLFGFAFCIVGAIFVDLRLIWGLALLALPSLAMTLMKPESRRSPSDVFAFTSLYFLRFLIAGAAVLSEGKDLIFGRNTA